MPDDRPVKYTIPEGNGGNSVDLEIQNPDGTVDRWRIARNELGGLKHWHDDADGNSSYAERPTADGDWYFQSFRPGTSTSGTPSREFTAEADLSRIYTPSYGADGDYLGTDVGVLNGRGLYDNQHVDLYQNTTFTRTVPNAAGGLDSVLVGQVDNTGHGWWADELDRRWDVYVDDNGNPARRRYDPATQQRSFVYQDGANTKNETIDSSGRIVNSLTFGPGNELLSSLSRDNGLLIEGKPGKDGELEYTFRDERDRRRGRLTYLPNGGVRLYYDGYEVVEYDGSGQEVKRYNRMGDRSVQAWLGDEARSAFLRAAGGAAEGIGGLTGVNNYINMAGEVLGYNPHLATRDEVLTGLEQGLRSFYHATRYFHAVSAREVTMYRTGNQGFAETLANIRPSFLAAANEESKLLIGTDWTGLSDSPGAVLGSATFGIGSWFVPTRVPRIPKSVAGRETDAFTPTSPTALTTRWPQEPVLRSDLMSPRSPGTAARTSTTRPTEPTALTNPSGRTPAWAPSFAVNGFEALRRAPRQVWAGIEQMGASVVVAARQTWEVLSNPHGELVTPEGIRFHSSSLEPGGGRFTTAATNGGGLSGRSNPSGRPRDGRRRAKTTGPSLTADNIRALEDYTGAKKAGGFRDINGYLRNPNSPNLTTAERADLQARADATSEALRRLPTAPGTTYRGVQFDDAVLAGYVRGRIVTEAAFTSTSRNPDVATGGFKGNVLMIVTGRNGRDVAPFAGRFAHQLETLYDKGTRFKVISKEWDKGIRKWTIVLEEVR